MLEDLIEKKKAKVAVIGLGYVGLPTAVEIARAGFFVFGIDRNKERVKQINKGHSYILDVSSRELKEIINSKKFRAVNNYEPLKKSDIILICVPTPLDKNKIPDISYIKSATEEIKKRVRPGQLIILESSTYPGTTEEVILPALQENGYRVGKDFYLAYSPERVDPGNKNYKLKNVSRVVGGVTQKCTHLAAEFYKKFIKAKVLPLSSCRAAEMTKLLENTFRLVNISMINELALLCGKMGIDIWEVIEAARTKPYGFYPFYPSAKIGGHCFDGNQCVFVKNDEKLEMLKISELYQCLSGSEKLKIEIREPVTLSAVSTTKFAYYNRNEKSLNSIYSIPALVNFFDTQFIFPNKIQILSFDLCTKKPGFAAIKIASKRKEEKIISLEGYYNHKLKVTERHPVIIYDNHRFLIKLAKDIKKEEKLVLLRNLPSVHDHIKIDLIGAILNSTPRLIDRFRVRPMRKKLKRKTLDLLGLNWDEKRIFYKLNYLPLTLFLKYEKQLNLKRNEVYLCAGRGPSFSQIKNIIEIDRDFARLIGYYLAEGCLTEEGKTKRIRFTFNSNEDFYIEDIKQILNRKRIKYSYYQDKKWQSFYIKISSEILGILFKEVLNCGKNCYEMQIPSQIFFSTKILRKEVLAGILRGEGGVYYVNQKRKYIKNKKEYNHNSNSICVSFYSSSPILFEQVQLILHEMGIFPRLDASRSQLLEITGPKNIRKLQGIFGGEKEKKIESYLKSIRKEIDYKKVKIYQNFIAIEIKNIKSEPVKEVFSLEVEPTNTLITNSGIIVHNCIPLDPFYLSWKAKEYNFFCRFIELAGEINEQMPHHIVTKIIWALNLYKKPIRGSKILIFGVAYKEGIGDTRESAAFDIMKELSKKGAKIKYHDPYVPEMEIDGKKLKSIKFSLNTIKKFDCLVILTAHPCYNYDEIAKKAKLVVDTKNAVKSRKLKNVFRL